MSDERKVNDGGPAFGSGAGGSFGMSLRDWIAGQALNAVVSASLTRIDRWEQKRDGDDGDTEPQWDVGDAEKWAYACYVLADAMIAERAKRG